MDVDYAADGKDITYNKTNKSFCCKTKSSLSYSHIFRSETGTSAQDNCKNEDKSEQKNEVNNQQKNEDKTGMSYNYYTQQNEHCDWLILGHLPLIKYKCILTGIQ